MEFKDYYAILGVPRSASEKEIKAAYRRLARKHHPDVNKGQAQAEARFKEVGEAYEVLSDPQKRRQYDEIAAGGIPFGQARPRGPGGPRGGRAEDLGDFSEFFRTFFGGGTTFGGGQGFGRPGGGFPSEPPATEVERPVDLSLHEVLHGATRELLVDGRRVEVRIPAGVREGARVRVAGVGGGGGRRGRAGDVFFKVAIARDPRFERRDDDLVTTFEVPLTTAVLGGEAQVATLESEVSIRIPERTPAGRTFRLRGHGLPKAGGGRGDLLASLAVRLPGSLDARQRELFESLRRAGL